MKKNESKMKMSYLIKDWTVMIKGNFIDLFKYVTAKTYLSIFMCICVAKKLAFYFTVFWKVLSSAKN